MLASLVASIKEFFPLTFYHTVFCLNDINYHPLRIGKFCINPTSCGLKWVKRNDVEERDIFDAISLANMSFVNVHWCTFHLRYNLARHQIDPWRRKTALYPMVYMFRQSARNDKIAWLRGLKRSFTTAFTSLAWVRIPPVSTLFRCLTFILNMCKLCFILTTSFHLVARR